MSANRNKLTKTAAAVVAVAVIALGANAITHGNSSSSTAAANGNVPTAQGGGPGNGAARPGMGTDVTGATLTKLKSVVTAKYPGTVEHAMQLADGSYVVHVIQSNGSGEVHVLVSQDFTITGTQQGGPPGGGAPPSGSTAPGTGSTTGSSES